MHSRRLMALELPQKPDQPCEVGLRVVNQRKVTALWAMVVAAPRQLVGHPAQVRGIHGVVLGTP